MMKEPRKVSISLNYKESLLFRTMFSGEMSSTDPRFAEKFDLFHRIVEKITTHYKGYEEYLDQQMDDDPFTPDMGRDEP